MPFAPGTPKPANSGRRKGSPNRLQAEVRVRCEELGCDPIEALVGIANDPKTPIELRARVLIEIAQYIYPKKRSVELSGIGGGPIEVSDGSAFKLLKERLDRLAQRLQGQGRDGGQAVAA